MSTMTERKRTEDRHKHKGILVRVPPWAYEAIQALAQRERRSRSMAALILLEEALQAKGLGHPPEEKRS